MKNVAEKSKKGVKPSKKTLYVALEFSKNDVLRWLTENMASTELVSDREILKRLNPDLMDDIASGMGDYLYNRGVFDDAMYYLSDNEHFDIFKRKI